MKSLTGLCLILGVVSSALAAPGPEDNALLVQPQQHVNLLTDSRKLIEQLVGNLRKSAQDALTAVGNFTNGIRGEAKHMREKIVNDIENLRNRVKEAIDNFWNRISNTTAGVRECVDSHRIQASGIFNSTVNKTMNCVDERISDIGDQIQSLAQLATNSLDYANQALGDMQQCTENNHNLFTAGACLGGIVIRVETKGLAATTQMGLSIARINLSIATLPAAMEICAGARLVEASLGTGKIIMDIGGCTASTIFSAIIGNTPKN